MVTALSICHFIKVGALALTQATQNSKIVDITSLFFSVILWCCDFMVLKSRDAIDLFPTSHFSTRQCSPVLVLNWIGTMTKSSAYGSGSTVCQCLQPVQASCSVCKSSRTYWAEHLQLISAASASLPVPVCLDACWVATGIKEQIFSSSAFHICVLLTIFSSAIN